MARFEKGTGKLQRRRKNARQVGNYFFKYDGRRINTGSQDRAEAGAFRRKFLGDVEHGLRKARARKVTVNELLDLVAGEYQARIRAARSEDAKVGRQRSADRLLSRLDRHLRPAFGGCDATNLSLHQIKRYVEERDTDGAAVASINRELETLRHAFRVGTEHELIQRIPTIKLRAENNVRQGFLDPEQYEKLLDAFDDEAVTMMYIIGFHVGWRAGCIKAIQWPQVDFRNHVIYPPAEQAENKWVGAAPIYGDLERALREAQLIHERDWPDCPWVVHRAGRRLVEYRGAWHRAVELAGFEDLKFHDLRRSAVRNMLDAGMDESKVMRIVGHKTRAMIDRYRIVSLKDVAKAGEQIGRYLEERKRLSKGETVQ